VSTLYDIPDDNDDDLLVRSSQQIVEALWLTYLP
jgi:hypothetical protein